MRKIKVRAWDKRNCKWIEQESLVMNQGLLFEDWRAFEDWVPLSEDEAESVESTGLEDKNGIEIYEGYYVEQSFTELGATEGIFNNPPDDMTSFIGEIKMYDGSWWIDSGSWAIPLFSELNPNEIIGNRFENPELLEAKE